SSRAARTGSGSTTIVEPTGATRSSAVSVGSYAVGTTTRASARHGWAASSRSGYTAVSRSGSTVGATRFGGDAARRNAARGPAQRQAAPRHSSTTSAGGPADTTPTTSRRSASSTPGSATSRSTTQPRTRRPCNGTRTIVPTSTDAAAGSTAGRR